MNFIVAPNAHPAHCADPSSETSAAPAKLGALCVVLCQPSHPGNVGAAARAMKTMGLTDLRLVRPEVFPSEIATARASGATDVLEAATRFETLAEALADCVHVVGTSARGRDFVGAVMPARRAIEEAIRLTSRGKVALVFGTEMSGLTNEEVAHCQVLTYISANPNYSSLNLAAAVQVLAYEARQAAEVDTGYAAPQFAPASQKDIENLFVHARQTMIDLNFLNPRVPKRLLPRLRRLFNRTRLEKEEVDIFRGLLRSIDELNADKSSVRDLDDGARHGKSTPSRCGTGRG